MQPLAELVLSLRNLNMTLSEVNIKFLNFRFICLILGV